MTKTTKIKNNIWEVFSTSLKIYFSNFSQLMRYMAFPVLGQLLGIILTLGLTFLYTTNLPFLITKFSAFNNFSTITLTLIILALPGLFIFTKAFWDFLIMYGAINSMVENALKSGKIYDLSAHTELITRRTPAFIGLWLLFGLFSIIGSNPLFWLIAGILFVYFVLIFQVFTFEPELSPIGCFEKSFKMIKGNFTRTLLLMGLVGGFTYIIIPEFINFILKSLSITGFLAINLEGWCAQFPTLAIPLFTLTPLLIANMLVGLLVTIVIIQFTLPLRSICWSLWYKTLEK